MKSMVEQMVKEQYGGTVPENVGEIVEAMLAEKTLGNKVFDKMEAKFNCSPGLFFAIKDAIKERREADCTKVRSAADVKADWTLRTRNSDGRAISRKW